MNLGGTKKVKIVFASDSFKGSLTSRQIGNIGKNVVAEIFGKECEVVNIPMADGGEGTVEALIEAMEGELVECQVSDPLGRKILATYGRFGKNAIMEMSAASGITLIEEKDRKILKQNTYGTGEMMLHALKNGVKNIYIGIGGSATNDGGIGFASAIGVEFLDSEGKILEAIPENFKNINEINISKIHPEIINANIIVMCDVTNPLLGPTGATNVFGEQKGADVSTRRLLEEGMAHYINIAENTAQKSVRYEKGSGAAGGLGAALKLFADAKMCSGITTILEIVKFREKIEGASLIITGEGRIDYQSAFGKVPSGVARVSKEMNIPCVAIVGSMGRDAETLLNLGLSAIVPTVNAIMSLSDAMENAEKLYELALRRTLRLLKINLKD